MVARWKIVLGRTMSKAISAMEAVPENRLAAVPLPPDDPWYQAHEDLEAIAPGTLLDSRPIEFRGKFTRGLSAKVWQLRYRSTDTAGRPISSVASLIVPRRAWAGSVPRPLVSYQIAIDSLGPKADPSYMLRRGSQKEPLLLSMALRRGWAVVTADYTGPRHACFAGKIAGLITLDGIRAALQLEEAGLSPDAPIGMWGYSGGGQATAWAAELQPTYAPELRLTAIAAGGIPTDNRALYRTDGSFLAGFALGAWVGISREYPEADLLGSLTDEGRKLVDEIADMNVEELIGRFPYRRIKDLMTVDDPFATEGALMVNEALSLGRQVPSAPVLIYHAKHDQLVSISEAEDLAATYRRGGVEVTLRRSILGEHILFHRVAALIVLRYLVPRLARPRKDS